MNPNIRANRLPPGYYDAMYEDDYNNEDSGAKQYYSFREYKYIRERWRLNWKWPPSNWKHAFKRARDYGAWQ